MFVILDTFYPILTLLQALVRHRDVTGFEMATLDACKKEQYVYIQAVINLTHSSSQTMAYITVLNVRVSKL